MTNQVIPKQKNIVILDGGTASQLVELGHTNLHDNPVWSSVCIKTHPDDIYKVHKQFYESGADISLTVSYQASIDGFKRLGVDKAEAIQLIKKSVHLARRAATDVERLSGRKCYVAGSVGPYGACLHDLSEYSGNYVENVSKSELSSWHKPRMKALIDAGIDLLGIETIPALQEAEAVLDVLKSFPNTQAYISFSCKDGYNTCHGEPLSDCLQTIFQSDQIIAGGINCTHPQYISSLLSSINIDTGNKSLLVKPNSGEDWTVGTGYRGRQKEHHILSKMVEEWVKLGANWIGGCCRIFPDDIAHLRHTLTKTVDLKGPAL